MKLTASGILYCNFGRCVVKNVVGNGVLAYRISNKSESRVTLKQEYLLARTISTSSRTKYWIFLSLDRQPCCRQLFDTGGSE
ncbi:putative Zinc finger FYVE domain-containing protein 26 like protein [Fusarium oxysporum f. sp. albedinis]|nr:putative Zinc finger FYVE domain-containing protein 26 like protein [Fusarium oxysporum f. sp. albedinis]